MQPNPAALQRIVEKVRDLPTLPTMVTRILAMSQDPNASTNDLEILLMQDPSLTVKVMRVANSSFYGNGNIETLKDAVLRLGFPVVRTIVLSTSVFESFPGTTRPGFDRGEFWKHSLAVAVASRMIARKQRFRDAEEAFVIGLVHDIGKIILDEYASEQWQEVIAHVDSKKVLIYEAEQAVLGCSHSQVGKWLAGKWNLPAHYSTAIFHHHHPAFADQDEKLVSFIHISDILARKAHLGSGGDPFIPHLEEKALEETGLERGDLETLGEELPEAFEMAASAFPLPGAKK